MTRYIYGAGGDAQVMATTGGVPIVASATVKSARTGGSTVSDVLNLAGGPLAGVVTPDSRGQVAFQGPDGMVSTLWLDFADGGPRWAVKPVDVEAAIVAKRAALMLAEYNTPSGVTAKCSIPYVTSTISKAMADVLDTKLIPKFASSAARDAAIPSPADGDQAYNTGIHVRQMYHTGLFVPRWINHTELISEVQLPNGTSNFVTFSSIPNNFRQIMLVWNSRAIGSTAGQAIFQPVRAQINADTGANYGYVGRAQRIKYVSTVPTYEVAEDGSGGNTSAATAATYSNLYNIASSNAVSAFLGYIPGSSAPASLFGGGFALFPMYAVTGAHRVFTAQSGFGNAAGATGTGYICSADVSGGYSSTSVIGSLTVLLAGSGTWTTGSLVSLYGLA